MGRGELTDKAWARIEPLLPGQSGRVISPYKGKKKPQSQKDANRAHAQPCGPGERANAQLKQWNVLRKYRSSPHRIGRLATAIHVLQNYEVTAG